MNVDDFNNKYEKYLEQGHCGLDVHNEEFIDWLDIKFKKFIKIPKFSYSQIKEKYYTGRFYCEGLTREQEKQVAHKITESCKEAYQVHRKRKEEYINNKNNEITKPTESISSNL